MLRDKDACSYFLCVPLGVCLNPLEEGKLEEKNQRPSLHTQGVEERL